MKLRYALLPALLLGAPLRASSVAGLPNFRDVARRIRPAVVNLSVVKDVSEDQQDPFAGQFFGRFFGQQGGPQQWFQQRSLGSGVIIDAKRGYILTNNHVVEGADAITVKFADKREAKGTVVGRDPKTDLAVVQVKGMHGLAQASFGDSDKVEVGDWVLAVGSPFGLEQTVSHGIISAKGRVIGEGPYDDFLQTDAPINPGNSGGPLVDMDGDVIGINTAITTQSGGSEGVGFAIPSDMARGIYRQIVEHGKVTRAWLGVSIQDLDPALAARFGLPADSPGVLIADVMPKGPAHDAGIRPGDVVLAFNGKAMADSRQLQRNVAGAPVGQRASLKIWRDGSARSVSVVLGDMTQSDAGGAQDADEEPITSPKLGVDVRPLTPDEAKGHGAGGVVVTRVDSGSAADNAGLQPGDVILELGKDRVAGTDQFSSLVAALKAGSSVVVRVRRDGRSFYAALQVPGGQ